MVGTPEITAQAEVGDERGENVDDLFGPYRRKVLPSERGKPPEASLVQEPRTKVIYDVKFEVSMDDVGPRLAAIVQVEGVPVWCSGMITARTEFTQAFFYLNSDQFAVLEQIFPGEREMLADTAGTKIEKPTKMKNAEMIAAQIITKLSNYVSAVADKTQPGKQFGATTITIYK